MQFQITAPYPELWSEILGRWWHPQPTGAFFNAPQWLSDQTCEISMSEWTPSRTSHITVGGGHRDRGPSDLVVACGYVGTDLLASMPSRASVQSAEHRRHPIQTLHRAAPRWHRDRRAATQTK